MTEACTLVPLLDSTSAKVTFRESNVMASRKWLESLLNAPLHATTVDVTRPGFAGGEAAGAAGAGVASACTRGFAGAGAGAALPLGCATAAGTGCFICDGASWSLVSRSGWMLLVVVARLARLAGFGAGAD